MWDIFSAQCLHNRPSLILLTEVAVPYFFTRSSFFIDKYTTFLLESLK